VGENECGHDTRGSARVFNYLQREKPELLSFRCRGLDKWQQVNAWLSKPHVLN
jgi:hypothetical protein